jgi:selenocysteine lyase/cysteine desulfurase
MKGVEEIQQTCRTLTTQLLDRLTTTAGVTVYGPLEASLRTSTIAFNIKGLNPSQAGQILDERFAVLCRIGLHCAPRAHTTAGTFPDGAIRFSPGVFTTPEEIETAADAVSIIAGEAGL